MRFTSVVYTLCVLVMCAGGCSVQRVPPQPTELAPGVWGVLSSPGGAGPHAGVVLLHGSRGWIPGLVDLASLFVDAGFVVLTIDYYAETDGTPSDLIGTREAWPFYQDAVRRAVEYLQSIPSVGKESIGLVGFSRGASLAVSVASSFPRVAAVVDFYGGGRGWTAFRQEDVRGMPPVLILHGDADAAVPVSLAHALHDAVVAAGGEAELHIYPGAGHSFNAPGFAAYSQEAADDAHKRTVAFLRKWLISAE